MKVQRLAPKTCCTNFGTNSIHRGRQNRDFCATLFQNALRFYAIFPGLFDASVRFVGATFSIIWVS